MPDITQIKVGTTTYDLADIIARRIATTTQVGLITEAPSDNKQYTRKNKNWVEVSSTLINVSSETLHITT